jgi:methyltransferase-like protein
MARSKDLDYLGDTEVQRMYIGNLPKNAMEKLGTITDIVRTEQYIDFIRNTQFRCTLLTHKETAISRNITNDTISKFHYYCNILPALPKNEVNLQDSSNVEFYLDNMKERTMASSDPAMKTILMVLSSNLGNPLSVKEIIAEAKKLTPQISEELYLSNINVNFAQLIFKNYIKFIEDKPKFIYKISNKPRISDLSLLQITKIRPDGNSWITTALNQLMGIQPHQINIVKSLDGKHNLEQIKANTLDDIINGKISAEENGKKIEDKKRLKEVADTLVDSTLETLRTNFCLIA